MTPDQVLRHASRVLKHNSAYMLPFLKELGVTPMLMVNYDDGSGEIQQWAGPVSDWPKFAREHEEDMGWIVSWDLVLGRLLTGGVDEESPASPYTKSARWLKNNGWVQ